MKDKLIYRGKVRYVYSNKDDENQLYMVSTDRVSSFDRQICIMNGKGEMLTKMSEFWFNATKHIIPNHMISTNSNEILVKKCKPIPIEFVVRGYITGNTNTSLWSHYSRGERNYCGINFQDGLIKNQRLSEPVVTPTTKSDHDEPISKNDIIERGLLTDKECDYIYDISLKLYNYGVKLSRRVGFILVDTKYEFGKSNAGEILLIDEIHTPDSSRYFYQETYTSLQKQRLPQKQLSKEFVRQWLIKNGFQGLPGQTLPPMEDNFVETVSRRYIELYEKIIGEDFVQADTDSIEERIKKALNNYFSN